MVDSGELLVDGASVDTEHSIVLVMVFRLGWVKTMFV